MEKHKEHAASEKAATTGLPNKWWQWIVIYPGLAVGILGTMPTAFEAVRSYNFGVPFGRSAEAQEQNTLWTENFDCAQKANFATITNNRKVEIGSFVCDSGDVLLRGKKPDSDTVQMRWVSWREITDASPNKTGALDAIFPAAHASETRGAILAAASSSPVLCQKWVAPGRLLQRIRTTNGCVDQVINTYTGAVVSTRSSQCNSTC